MFDQIFGLPAHPLIVHVAVVLTPLLAVLVIAYAALPLLRLSRLRHRLDWAVVLSALAAPVAVFAARESGEAFGDRLFQGNMPAPVVEHESLAGPLTLLTVGLAVAALLLVRFTRPRPEGPAAGPAVVAVSAVAVVFALAVGYYVVRLGHSGATAVWGG